MIVITDTHTDIHRYMCNGFQMLLHIFYPRRCSQEIFEDLAGLWCLRQTFRLRDNDEAPSGDAHRRKAVLVQSLRKTIHAEGESEGESTVCCCFLSSGYPFRMSCHSFKVGGR